MSIEAPVHCARCSTIRVEAVGGAIETLIMRIVDIQLSFPAILIALILLAVLAGTALMARRFNVAPAILLLLTGIALAQAAATLAELGDLAGAHLV